jgi:hypothetical protein
LVGFLVDVEEGEDCAVVVDFEAAGVGEGFEVTDGLAVGVAA